MSDKVIPKFIAYHRDNFMGSVRVNRRLTWLQRHIYLRLCLEAPFCDTRPYLPTDDAELALLADVPDEVWTEHRDAVLKMFTKFEQGYSHPRIISESEKACESYTKFSEWGKKSGEARRAKANGGSTPAEQISVDQSIKDQSNKENNTRVNEPTDSLASLKRASDSIDSDARRSNSHHLQGTETETTESYALRLVQLLHLFLSQRKDWVTIPDNYEKLWLEDFKSLLEAYQFDDIQLVICYSQLPRNQKYYVRAASLVKNFESLCSQATEPTNREHCALILRQARAGRLPPPKKEKQAKTVTESMGQAFARLEPELEGDIDL